MISILEPTARWLLVIAEYCAHRGGEAGHDALRSWEQRRDNGEEMSEAVLNAGRELLEDINGNGQRPAQWGELRAELERAFNPANPPDYSLVDRIIDILKLPNSGNILGGTTLDALRKALLSQDELAGLDDRLKAANTHCGMCGKTMYRNEISSLYTSSNRLPDASYFCCTRCMNPMYRACSYPKCEENIVAANYDANKPATLFCSTHQPGKKKAKVDGTAVVAATPFDSGAVTWHTTEGGLIGAPTSAPSGLGFAEIFRQAQQNLNTLSPAAIPPPPRWNR